MRLARGELNVLPVKWAVHTEMQTELLCVTVLGAALCTSRATWTLQKIAATQNKNPHHLKVIQSACVTRTFEAGEANS